MMKTPFLWVAAFIVSLSVCATADYSISWSAIGNAGGQAKSGTFQIEGLAGQPAAGLSHSFSRVLNAGFWAGNYGCTVNLTDLALFAEGWLSSSQAFEFDMDGFALVASYWFCQCPADWLLK